MAKSYSKIITLRSIPGVMIFDTAGKMLYINREASAIIPGPGAATGGGDTWNGEIPPHIANLCLGLVGSNAKSSQKPASEQMGMVINTKDGQPYSARAFLIEHNGTERDKGHIMVLIEKIIGTREINLEHAREEYNLTKRELLVLKLICRGCSNKDISIEMFISEHTVKDHIKNILRKTGASSRSEVVAFIQ